MSFEIIIPARLESTRLPGKVLLDVAGKTLIERVYDCAIASNASAVYVATDNQKIAATVSSFGGRAIMTSSAHANGTDRLAEAVEKLFIPDGVTVINLQGDEPDMPPNLINELADALQNSDAPVATVCAKVKTDTERNDPSVVKVVCDQNNYALYFSRATIPHAGNNELDSNVDCFRHIGIYAYRADYLKILSSRPPCELETVEGLEQLRVLWWGDKIKVIETESPPSPGMDTPEDLERMRRTFA